MFRLARPASSLDLSSRASFAPNAEAEWGERINRRGVEARQTRQMPTTPSLSVLNSALLYRQQITLNDW